MYRGQPILYKEHIYLSSVLKKCIIDAKKSHLWKMCLKERGVFLLCWIQKPLLCLVYMLTVFLLLSAGLSP